MERVAIHFLPESNMPNQGHRGESISSQEIMVDQMGTVHVTTAKVSFQGESRHTKQPAELSVTVRLEATSWKVASQLCILNRKDQNANFFFIYLFSQILCSSLVDLQLFASSLIGISLALIVGCLSGRSHSWEEI
jgi:hypothetical protein